MNGSRLSRAVLVTVWLFAACGGRSSHHDTGSSGSGATSGATHAVGGSTMPGNANAGSVQGRGGTTALGGATEVGTAGEQNGTAGEANGTVGKPNGIAGDANGAAGESPIDNVAGAGAGGQPDTSGGAAGASSTCESDGKTYAAGEGWTNACQVCSCRPGGVVSCDSSLCRAVCLSIAKQFAILHAQFVRCDVTQPNACAQFVGPASLSCDCPTPYGVDVGAQAQALRERYQANGCGTSNPECDCPAWDSASCVEGRCEKFP